MSKKSRSGFRGKPGWSPGQIAKARELSSTHGTAFDDLIDDGRISISALGNFYGRHVDRQSSILAAMRDGDSYSLAYSNSKTHFDTKRWGKIPSRSASCRGLVLKAVCCVAQHSRSTTDDELSPLFRGIQDALTEQMRQLVRHEVCADQRNVEKKVPNKVKSGKQTYEKSLTGLRTAHSKLAKNARDLPHMQEQLGCSPTVRQVAATAVESGRMLASIRLWNHARNSTIDETQQPRRSIDRWGLGIEHATHLRDFSASGRADKVIATHRVPDADALVSAWLMERFIFAKKDCQVVFVARDFKCVEELMYDAVVDVSKVFDPSRLIFDHKPPAFAHRDEHCATSLVWEHAISLGCRIKKLKPLVELVHDGDAATRRNKSVKYKASRTNGLHAIVKTARNYAENEQILYQGIAAYLDAKFIPSRQVKAIIR